MSMKDHCKQLYTVKWDNLEEMEQVLETYHLPRLNHEKVENPNRPITSKENESVIKNLPKTTKFQNQVALQVNYANI